MPAVRRIIRLNNLHTAYDSLPPEMNQQTKCLSLASGVLRTLLGEEWFERHVMPEGKKGFLTVDKSTPIKRELSFARIIDIAEAIYNIQEAPGFDDCIRRMREGDIEGTLAEFDFGRMLYINSVPFRFVVSSGVKKQDYDIEILYPNEIIACADAKCKIETTEFSEGGLRNVMKDARDQLPNDRPGIVFIKVPPRWIENERVRAALIQRAKRFLGGVRRIVSVKYYSAPISFQNNMLRIDHAYKEVSNPKTDFGNDINWDIFKKADLPPEANGMPPHWQRIFYFPDGKPK